MVFRLENVTPVAIHANLSDPVMFHALKHLPLLSSPKPENERTSTSEDVTIKAFRQVIRRKAFFLFVVALLFYSLLFYWRIGDKHWQ
jgi:hypothetical protein